MQLESETRIPYLNTRRIRISYEYSARSCFVLWIFDWNELKRCRMNDWNKTIKTNQLNYAVGRDPPDITFPSSTQSCFFLPFSIYIDFARWFLILR